MGVSPRTSRSAYVRVLDPARLRKERQRKELTLRGAAELISRSHTYVSMIESGAKRTVSPATARRLHLLYGPSVEYDDLFADMNLESGRSAA